MHLSSSLVAAVASWATLSSAAAVLPQPLEEAAHLEQRDICASASFFAVQYPVLINQCFYINETIILHGLPVLNIINAPACISTTVFAVSTSATTPSMPTFTAVTGPFVVQVSLLGGRKRQTGTTYLGANGTIVSSSSSAKILNIAVAHLVSDGGVFSTNAGVTSMVFASSGTVGSISTTFSFLNNALSWSNPSFSNGQALFCSLKGTVYAVFNGTYPTNCTPVSLTYIASSSLSVSTGTIPSSMTGATTRVSIPGVTAGNPIAATSGSSGVTAIPTTTASLTQTFSNRTMTTLSKTSSVPATSVNPGTPGVTGVQTPAFIESMLLWHNTYRANHQVANLTYDLTLAALAQVQAEKCIFAHTANDPYGENIAAGSPTNPAYYIYVWYAEISSYNYASPGYSDATGHFTQLVWKGSNLLGCGYADCTGKADLGAGFNHYLWCEYSPAGNIVNPGYFAANVLPPLSTNYPIPPGDL